MSPTLTQRLRSARHRLSLTLSQRLRPSRGGWHPQAAGDLPGLAATEAASIATLHDRHGVRFEASLPAKVARDNYRYLAVLDDTLGAIERPAAPRVTDAGCANFWYAAALHAYFRPRELVGVEVDGWRRYRDGWSRHDHATGYAALLPGTRYLVGDYTRLELPADVVTAWFPFVTAPPLLAWGLPLSLLRPAAFFASVRRNLAHGGLFLMVNRRNEAAVAGEAATAAGLAQRTRVERDLDLVDSRQAVTVSVWG